MLNLQLLPPLRSNPCYALVPFSRLFISDYFLFVVALAWKLFCILGLVLCWQNANVLPKALAYGFICWIFRSCKFFVCNSLHFNCYFYISICNLKLHSLYSYLHLILLIMLRLHLQKRLPHCS